MNMMPNYNRCKCIQRMQMTPHISESPEEWYPEELYTGMSPERQLIKAIRLNDKKKVRSLMDAGMDLNDDSIFRVHPLVSAITMAETAYDNDFGIADLLIDSGANVDVEFRDHVTTYTPLLKAVSKRKRDTAKFLLSKGANINYRNNKGETPLSLATDTGDVAVVDLLLEYGANTEFPSDYGITALMLAALAGNIDITDRLLSAGAVVNTQNESGRTALMCAADRMYRMPHENDYALAVIDRLLVEGADTALQDKHGNTALLYAVQSEPYNLSVVQRLIEMQRGINEPNNDGNTPLIQAARKGHIELVKVLLDGGADPTIVNREGKAAKDVTSNPEILNMLKRATDARTVSLSRNCIPSSNYPRFHVPHHYAWYSSRSASGVH